MVSRVERGPVADWMRTADRWLIGSFVALMVIGLVMALAASPAVAERLNLSTFHFVDRQALMLIPTAALMIATSFLSPRHVRRAALLPFIVSFALIILALMFGAEVKGARRWIFGLQPSEFIKPAFVVLAAWAFTEGGRTGPTAIPAKILSFLLLPLTIVPLILEPDFGQTMLVAIVWTSLFFLAGLHWFWVVAVGGHRHGRRFRGVQTVAARARARAALSRSGLDRRPGRHLSGRHRLAEHPLGRLVRTRAGRGRLQAHPARRAHRLRLRRDRRGIRHDRVHGADRLFRLHRAARAHSRLAQPGPVLPARRRRPDGHVRRAELDQHGGQSARHAGQGDDLAVHLLRRLVAARARPRHGLPHRDDPQAPGRRSRASRAAGRNERGALRSCSRRAARAAISFPRRRWPRRSRSAERKSSSRPTAGRSNTAAIFPPAPFTPFRPRRPPTPARSPRRAPRSLLGAGLATALVKLRRIRPRAVVGFGGYPTVPPLLAAWLLRDSERPA